MKKISSVIICLSLFLSAFAQKNNALSFYQISVYHYKDASQEKTINQYLEKALLPALHRMNTQPVGVFTSLANDTSADKTMYVFMPVKSLNEIAALSSKLTADKAYSTEGNAYLNAPFNAPPYTRMETILLQAFPLAPLFNNRN